MSVIKVIELVGQSDQSWDDAVKHAVSEAAKTVRNMTGVEVKNWTATIENDNVSRYRANVQIAFMVES